MDSETLGCDKEAVCPKEVFASDEVIESLKNSFFLVDESGRLVYACPILARLLRTSQAGMAGKNIQDLIPAGYAEHFSDMRARLRSGRAIEFEWELTDEKGEPSYVRVSLNPWRKGDKVVGAVGMAFDITEEVMAERELEKKVLLLRMQMDVLESLSETGGITETLREIVDRAADALGMDAACLASIYPSERGWLSRQIIDNKWPMGGPVIAQWKEIPGKSLSELLDHMDIFSLEQGEGPLEWLSLLEPELVIVTPMASSPNGAFVLILASSEARQWHGFEKEFLEGLVSIGSQALQRAEMVGTLRQAEESYMGLAESVSEAIAIVESENVVFVNQAMARLMGVDDPNELKGTRLGDFLLPESLQDVRLRSHRKELGVGKLQVRVRRPGGEEFTTEVEISHLPYGHRRAYQVMIKGDMGGEDPQDMEFMSRLSHDFRTPLVSVTGFADLLERLTAGREDEKVEECVQGIKRGINRLSRMVENMLTLARAESVPSESWSDSGRVLQEVIGDLRQFIYETGLEIKVPEKMPEVKMSESELQEVFQNLLSNAIRAVRGVANPRVTVGYEFSGSYHIFSFEDNGVGIPQKYHESVFKPLFRLTSGADGSGLGLSIVRKILRAHGGDIWVKSASGFGTTFYFSIPSEP